MSLKERIALAVVLNFISAILLVALTASTAATTFAEASDASPAHVQLPPPSLERKLELQRHKQQQPRPSNTSDVRRSFYDALPGATGNNLVEPIQAADYGGVANLEWVDNARLQHAITTEANVAGALPGIVERYDGSYASIRLLNLLRFLYVVKDIHFWCIRSGAESGGTCTDGVWRTTESWEVDPGSAGHQAVASAVNAIRNNSYFGDAGDEHGDTIIEAIRTAHEDYPSFRPVWLRVVAELDYNDPTTANVTH